MILLSDLDFSLPLKNPVIIFSLVLFIILFAPILFNKIKLPHIIGLIVAGVIIGPYGFNLLLRDSSMVLFGTVGLLYIMFLAGLEIDLAEFKKNSKKIFFFGFTTFIIPLVLGSLASYYILDYSILSSVLLASMFSTHTLVSFPIASRYGITKNPAVTLTIGGTMVTDIFALLMLAIVAGMTKKEVSSSFWLTLGIGSLLFVLFVFLVFPIIARWFFKRFNDSVSQYIFVLAMVFLGSFLAEAAGIEAIIGAFFSGLVLNRFIPHSSVLMNRIDFVGNALFIPFFLISVGMLVNLRVLVNGFAALKVAGVIILVAIISKYFAAIITKKTFKLTNDEGRIIFGLSTSHAAATLAIILVGYNIIIGETASGEPIRLLGEEVLNGTILLILISCAVGSYVVEKAAVKIALAHDEVAVDPKDEGEKILISLAYPDTVEQLVDFGLLLKPKKSTIPVYALHIISDETNDGKTHAAGKKMIERAVKHAAATENVLQPLTRFDMNVSNGIIYTIKEQSVSDVLIGLHRSANQTDLLGPIAENIVNRTSETIYIYKSVQPLNTLKRMVVLATPKAELEPGFAHWLAKISNIAKEAALAIHLYSTADTAEKVNALNASIKEPVKIEFTPFSNWEDFLIFSRELKRNDLFVIISSRKGHWSYSTHLEKLPYYLGTYFGANSFILLYPKQTELSIQTGELVAADGQRKDSLTEPIASVKQAGNFLKRLLKKSN